MKVENVYNLNAENKSINKELELLSSKIEKEIEFTNKGTVKPETVQTELNDALIVQKNNIQKHQDNQKKYKLLQKYGNVLEDIKKLLNLITINEDLSFEVLTQKIEELIKNRTSNAELISFSTIQNLFTELTNDLLEIEESYQNGSLSSSAALEKVNKVKANLHSHIHEIPYSLRRSHDELNHLISLYQNAFVAENNKASGTNTVKMDIHKVGIYNQVKFTELNTKTREFSSEIADLHQDVSKFEPQVNLDNLYKNLKDINKTFKEENWNYDTASAKVTNLKSTTTKLTNKQIQKNKEHESYNRRISLISDQMSSTTNKYTKEITIQNMKEANLRTEKANANVEKIKDLADGSCAMPEDIAKQYGNLMSTQLEDDEYHNSKKKALPNVVSEIYDDNIESTVENIVDMQNYVDALEKDRVLQFKPENPNDPDNTK